MLKGILIRDWAIMDYDDFYDDHYQDHSYGPSSGSELPEHQSEDEKNLDSFDFHDPESAYFFLSDDVQEEIQNSLDRKLKCLLCEHEFVGRKTDHCPVCYGMLLEEWV